MSATETLLPAPSVHTLPDTASRCERRVEWTRGRLRVSQRRRSKYTKRATGMELVAYYEVREFQPDAGFGRAFVFLKHGEAKRHEVMLSGTYVECNCSAGTYRPDVKASERAAAEGREAPAASGCVHAASLLWLVSKGLV